MSAWRTYAVAAFLVGTTITISPSPVALAATDDLFFSEYIEGSSNNKALEIYNGTGAAVDLGAGGYTVEMYFNGSLTAGLTVALAGNVADADVFVLAQASANAAILAQADQTNGAGWFNGDDAVVLKHNGVVLDVIGQVGFDPGTEWGSGLISTADNTLARDPSICAGDTVGSDAFAPSAQWLGSATDTVSGLGAHTAECGDDGDAAPSVISTSPTDGATGVALDATITVTFNEAVTLDPDAFALSCDASGAHTTTVSGGPAVYVLDPDGDFENGESCTLTVAAAAVADDDIEDPPDNPVADQVFTFTTELAPVSIHDIQQATHVSSLAGTPVTTTGIVTALASNGFYFQEPNPDDDPATSEGLFVFTNSAPGVAVGDAVRVSGNVAEFRPGGSGGTTNLTTTEITGPTTTVQSSGNPLPAATVIGAAGRTPPGAVIDDDATGNVETSGTFDAATDGIDFYESLEGMRVQVDDAIAVGPTNGFGEIFVVADGGAGAALRTPRGGVLVRPNDFNPERIALDDTLLLPQGLATPLVNTGDGFTTSAVGVLDYSFGNFKLNLTAPLTRVDNGLTPEVTRAPARRQLAVATFNVENLAGTDPQAKYDALADQIVDHLRAPDVIAIEEIQDDNGTTNDAVVGANTTLSRLVAAISAAGGPSYQWRQIDPVDDQDGGAPGGNIRVGFLFRTDRGVTFVDRPGGTSTSTTTVQSSTGGPQLSSSPGRIDPGNAAWAASRKPLVGEFRFQGETVFVIANHFNSKGGDQPLFGRFQPPGRVSEVQRHQQAQIVNSFVDSILAIDGGANVIVLGDINDFDFSETVSILKGGVLHNLMDTLPANERYSYVFDGNSQVLDQILVSDGLAIADPFFDPVHINAEFFAQQSDHDPSVTIVDFDEVWRYSGPHNLSATGLNSAIAGQIVPIGFTLGDNFGLDVLDGDPTSIQINCSTRAPIGTERVARYAGPRPLSYDSRSEIYTFRWDTESTWRGTCRLFTFRLDDGTVKSVAFRFST